MFSLITRMHVRNLKGGDITAFFARCNDDDYRRWWPGTHLHLHTTDGKPAGVGSSIFMDEFIGKRRVHMTGQVTAFEPGKLIVWHAKAGVRLPVRLIMRFEDDDAGVFVTHTIEIGYARWGGWLDPLFRLWFTPGFAAAMDEHVKTEFPRLRDLIHAKPHAPSPPERDASR